MPTPADPARSVLLAVRACNGPFNLASLVEVRKRLAGLGLVSRQQQDAAIRAARIAGMVTGSGLEGRHGISAEELLASIPEEGGHLIGYLSVRE